MARYGAHRTCGARSAAVNRFIRVPDLAPQIEREHPEQSALEERLLGDQRAKRLAIPDNVVRGLGELHGRSGGIVGQEAHPADELIRTDPTDLALAGPHHPASTAQEVHLRHSLAFVSEHVARPGIAGLSVAKK